MLLLSSVNLIKREEPKMIDTLNEIIGGTAFGKLDSSVLRSHVTPELIRAWEYCLKDLIVLSICLAGSEVAVTHGNGVIHIDCDDRPQAEKFLLFLLASKSTDPNATIKINI